MKLSIVVAFALLALPQLGNAQSVSKSPAQILAEAHAASTTAMVDLQKAKDEAVALASMQGKTPAELVSQLQSDAAALKAEYDSAINSFEVATAAEDYYGKFMSTWNPSSKNALYQVAFGSVNALLLPTVTLITNANQVAMILDKTGVSPQSAKALETVLATELMFAWVYPLNISMPFLVAINNNEASIQAFGESLDQDMKKLDAGVKAISDSLARFPN